MGEILEESVRLDCDLDLPESDDSGSEESRDGNVPKKKNDVNLINSFFP